MLFIADTTESNMFHAAVAATFHPSGNAISRTIAVIAKEGTSPQHMFLCMRFIRVEAAGRAFGIFDSGFYLLVVIAMVEIGAP